MTARYLGGKSVGQVVPAMPITLAQLQSLMVPQLAKQADIEAQLATPPFTPPDPARLIAMLEDQAANLAQTLAALPGLDAKAKVELRASLDLVNATLARASQTLATVSGALSTGGLHAYVLDSTTAQLGSDLAGATEAGLPGGGGPSAKAKALVIVTESPSAWDALSAVVRTA